MVIKCSTHNIHILNIYSHKVFYGDVCSIIVGESRYLKINAKVPKYISELLEV